MTRHHPEWHTRAACAHHPNPDLWFPTQGRHQDGHQAAAICRTCPALNDCHAWAEQHDPPYGVWGGVTQSERDEQRGRPHTNRIDPWVAESLAHRAGCGTTAGYARHKRRGEPTCQPCRDANTRYSAERLARAPHTRTHNKT